MKAIIVEDEKEGMENLILKLRKHCQFIEIIDQCATGESAIQAINEKKPDLVFLDIQLGTMTGFDVLNQVQHIPFEIIFITSYDQYAIKAIKANALDYLQKPVKPEELKEAVNKAKEKIQTSKRISRISIPISNGFQLISVNDITYCQADNVNTYIYRHKQKRILVVKILSDIHEKLPKDKFCRIHRSTVINLDYVESFHRSDGGYVVMKDNTDLSVARPRLDNFLKLLEKNMRYSG